MNAEQIRAEAIEVLAREFFGADEPGAEPFEDWAPRYRRKAAPYVDALAAAGLLPVETQRLAAYAALDTSDEHLMQRYLTEWRAVTE